MRIFKLLLIIAALTLFALACNNAATNTNQTANVNTRPAVPTPAADSTPSAPTDEVAIGRATYAQFCIRCHKPDGTGGLFEEENGKKLKVPSLREGHALKHTDKELSNQIIKGGEGMPAFKGRLDQPKIDELIRFIHKEFQGQSTSPNNNANTTPAH
ncbi:MAG: cytochrome c [Acidobacteria bacterium]|nr:cytochrome c [Acidobacteriota bacterium]